MKVCVFSDSHGRPSNMISVIGIEEPDLIFFLGDGERDLEEVKDIYPDLPIYSVRGNCDLMSQSSLLMMCNVGGVNIFATHGHMYYVKQEPKYDTLAAEASRAGASVALFGHTHIQDSTDNLGVQLINPGSIGAGIYGCYAVLNIENGFCNVDLKAV